MALLLGIEFLRSDIRTILYCKRNDPRILKSCLYTLLILLTSLYSIVAGAMLHPERPRALLHCGFFFRFCNIRLPVGLSATVHQRLRQSSQSLPGLGRRGAYPCRRCEKGSQPIPQDSLPADEDVAADSAVCFRASVFHELNNGLTKPYSAQVPSTKISTSLPSSRIPTICRSSDPTIKSLWIIESLIPFA